MTTPRDPQSGVYCTHNGGHGVMLDRFAVSEICKGWPVYRDASEWKNYRNLFVDQGAYVWTTWSGPKTIDDFIAVSKAGKARGDFIMHRENGTLVDLNPDTSRAIGKMKATITQRFEFEDIEIDVECDCRFIFFCLKTQKTGEPQWKTKYVKLFYEKDRVVPVDGINTPVFTKEEIKKYPKGYQYLGAAQARLGHPVLTELPTLGNQHFHSMYKGMEDWLNGGEVDLFWEKSAL